MIADFRSRQEPTFALVERSAEEGYFWRGGCLRENREPFNLAPYSPFPWRRLSSIASRSTARTAGYLPNLGWAYVRYPEHTTQQTSRHQLGVRQHFSGIGVCCFQFEGLLRHCVWQIEHIILSKAHLKSPRRVQNDFLCTIFWRIHKKRHNIYPRRCQRHGISLGDTQSWVDSDRFG